MQLRIFSFLTDDNQPEQIDSKDTEIKNEKCSDIAVTTMAKTVNFVVHCNTNHHMMTFPFLILWGCSKGSIYFGSMIVVRNVINFNLSLSLRCADTASVG